MDRALLARVEKQAWFHRYPRGWPLLLFVLASIGTAISVISIERADEERRKLEIDRNAVEIASGLQRRASENIALLRAGAAFLGSREEISQEQFTEFVNGSRGDINLHGSLGMGWARQLDVDAVQDFEATIRERRKADYLVYPRSQASQEFVVPIVYLVPLTSGNRRALGYDMYSEPVRREAMNEAARLGRPVASGKVNLVQNKENPDEAGFLMYMPVYERQQGRRIVKGYVYSPFSAEEFLNSAAELYRNRNVEIALHDEARTPGRLLARRDLPGENGISIERRINIADRQWILQVTSKRQQALSTISRLTLLFGAIAALLVMLIGRLLTKRAAEDREVLEWFTREAAIRNSLTRELNHRVKNTLANVLSIVTLTRRRATDIEDFTNRVTARIRALSATHDLLSRSNWSNAPLGEIIHSELAPYFEGSESRIEMTGPDISLAPNDALSLGLAIHELATNAAKYGALSNEDGRIHVTWELISPELAEVRWREEGGPPVVEPSTRGFGRDLIERIVAQELRSGVDLRFKPEGVECTLRVPVRRLAEFALRRTGNEDED